MASTPILPFAKWLAGTNQNSISANDNSLRNQILNGNVTSQVVTAQPGSPAEGDAYIIAPTHTGTQWATFTPKDLAIFSAGTWYAFAPTEGNRVSVSGTAYVYTSGAWVAAGGGGLVNPMTTTGDLIYGDTPSGGVAPPKRLAASTNGYVLTLAAGVPTWAVATGGFSNPMTTAGDLILGGVSGSPGRLAIGSSAQVLTVTAGVVGWSAASSGFSNPMTAVGDLIVGGTSGAAGRLASGASAFVLTSNGPGVAPTWQASSGGGGGGLTGFSSSIVTATPNATSNVSSLASTATSTNADVALVAKGNGATSANVPDNTTTGGNKRGDRSTDWQKSRTDPAQVASASYSVISGGQNNTASGGSATVTGGAGNSAIGLSSTVGGNSNTVSGDYASAFGSGNSISGNFSVAFGRSNNLSGQHSFASGREGNDRGVNGARVYSTGRLFNQYDTQRREFILKAATTDATITNLTTDNLTADVNNQVSALNGTQSFLIRGEFHARDITSNDSWFATFGVSVKVISGTPSILGTPTITDQYRDSGASSWVLAFSGNTSPRVLELKVTGQSGKSIRWNCYVSALELSNS